MRAWCTCRAALRPLPLKPRNDCVKNPNIADVKGAWLMFPRLPASIAIKTNERLSCLPAVLHDHLSSASESREANVQVLLCQNPNFSDKNFSTQMS